MQATSILLLRHKGVLVTELAFYWHIEKAALKVVLQVLDQCGYKKKRTRD